MATASEAGGWQVEGSAAEAYERYLVPVIFEAAAGRLVEAAGVGAGEQVLDVACGTGVVARAAARRVGPTGAVTGVDVNPEMLAAARRSGEAGAAIEWRQADVVSLPFDDGVFDVVLCQEAVQFFPDPVAAMREMRRVAVSGGRVAFSVFRSLEHHPVYATFAGLLGEHVGPEAEAMMGSPFGLGDAGRLRSLAHEAGLRDVEIRIAIGEERFPSVGELVRWEAASSPLAGPLGRLPEGRRGALVAALERQLASRVDDAGLVFHNETHVVTARA